MTYVYPFLALLLPPLLPVLLPLRWWMSLPTTVAREVIDNPAIPAQLKPAILTCMDDAHAADRTSWLYDLSAPLVMLLVLPFVPREADFLPPAFRHWDNDVSMNGDGEAILRNGSWLTAGHDISWEAYNAAVAHGERAYRYADPAYEGDAYYARGHRPRSFWARYVWLGWRNRASALSLALGREVPVRPVVLAGDPDIGTDREGFTLFACGDTYGYRSIRKVGPFVLIRHYGFKLGIVRNTESGTGRAAVVAIGRSLKRRGA